MSNEAHNAKLNQKREERRQQAAADSPLEKREVVMHGAKLKCQYAQGLGKLVVTSNELLLQDQLWATKADGNNMVNLQFQGTCGHPKWPQRKMTPPPCMSVIKLTPWQNLGTTIVQEQTVLVKESYINCDPEFNTACAKPIQTVASIKPAAPPKIKREIYLTFDDGIQAGTEEVLAVLKEKGVKATFYLTGIHVYYFIEKSKDRKKALGILKDIYENHAIGNHSYSHVNDFYQIAYSGGVKVKGDGSKDTDRRSILDDFTKCKETIYSYLDEIYGKGVVAHKETIMAKNQTIPIARFPGRNTWYTNKIKDIDSDNGGDTKEEAKELFDKRKYQIYGWDCEWKMTFNFHDDSVKHVKDKKDKGTMDFSKEEDAHPFFDMYSAANIGKDRLSESWENVRNTMLDKVYDGGLMDDVGKTNGKVVLLMHDRAFRKGKLINNKVDLSNTEYIDKLKNLIDYFLKIRAEFKTNDKY
jgi:hypothetical protein